MQARIVSLFTDIQPFIVENQANIMRALFDLRNSEDPTLKFIYKIFSDYGDEKRVSANEYITMDTLIAEPRMQIYLYLLNHPEVKKRLLMYFDHGTGLPIPILDVGLKSQEIVRLIRMDWFALY